jgi:hypothetical protein
MAAWHLPARIQGPHPMTPREVRAMNAWEDPKRPRLERVYLAVWPDLDLRTLGIVERKARLLARIRAALRPPAKRKGKTP